MFANKCHVTFNSLFFSFIGDLPVYEVLFSNVVSGHYLFAPERLQSVAFPFFRCQFVMIGESSHHIGVFEKTKK